MFFNVIFQCLFRLKYFDTSMHEHKYDQPRDKVSFEKFIAEKLGTPVPEDAVRYIGLYSIHEGGGGTV